MKHVLLRRTGISVCILLTIPFFAVAQREGSPSVDQQIPRVNQQTPKSVLRAQQLTTWEEYEKDVQRLKAFSNASEPFRARYTLRRFQREAETLMHKWEAKDVSYYYDCVRTVCQLLSGIDWKSHDPESKHLYSIDHHKKIATEYLRTAWEKSREPGAKEIPIGVELNLIVMLAGGDWPRERSEKVALMVHGFERLKAEIDEDYDMSESLPMQPPFPKGFKEGYKGFVRGGMSPAAITDPVLRAEYERLIAEHKRKRAKRNHEGWLRQQHDYYSHSICHMVILPVYLDLLYKDLRNLGRPRNPTELETSPDTYIKNLDPPYTVAEFEAFLDTYIEDDELRRKTRARYYELVALSLDNYRRLKKRKK